MTDNQRPMAEVNATDNAATIAWTLRDTLIVCAMGLVCLAFGLALRTETALSLQLTLVVTLSTLGGLLFLHLVARRVSALGTRLADAEARLEDMRMQVSSAAFDQGPNDQSLGWPRDESTWDTAVRSKAARDELTNSNDVQTFGVVPEFAANTEPGSPSLAWQAEQQNSGMPESGPVESEFGNAAAAALADKPVEAEQPETDQPDTKQTDVTLADVKRGLVTPDVSEEAMPLATPPVAETTASDASEELSPVPGRPSRGSRVEQSMVESLVSEFAHELNQARNARSADFEQPAPKEAQPETAPSDATAGDALADELPADAAMAADGAVTTLAQAASGATPTFAEPPRPEFPVDKSDTDAPAVTATSFAGPAPMVSARPPVDSVPTSPAFRVPAPCVPVMPDVSGRGEVASAPPPPPTPLTNPAVDRDDTIERLARTGQVELFLQPVLMLPDRKVAHFQVQPRLRTTSGVALSEAEFGAAADRRGVRALIDQAALDETVRVLAKLVGGGRSHVLFAEISSDAAQNPAFVEALVNRLAADRSVISHLALEFAQADMLTHDTPLSAHIGAIRETGVKLSLSRVGSPARAIADARDVGATFVRLKPNHLRDLVAAAGPSALMQVMAAARTGGIEIIVEQVNDEQALSDTLSSGAGLAQGDLFFEPKPLVAEAA